MGCWRKGHSLSCPRRIPLSLPSLHLVIPLRILHPALRVRLSRSLGVMTAGRQRVRKLECCVLTGVRGMLTGEQTEGTDGSVTCPRSSDMPLPAALDLKPNTFTPASFVLL